MFLLEARRSYFDQEGNLQEEWIPVFSASKKDHIREFAEKADREGVNSLRMLTLTAVGSTPTAVTYKI